jgi:hypothetical protein
MIARGGLPRIDFTASGEQKLKIFRSFLFAVSKIYPFPPKPEAIRLISVNRLSSLPSKLLISSQIAFTFFEIIFEETFMAEKY